MEEHTTDTPKRVKTASRTKVWLLLLITGLLLGLIISTAARFVLIKDTAVHHHANFALYVNGQEDKFSSFTFYEEVAACTDPSANNPKVRVHMHDNKAGLVHVHDGGVTLGHFFENLGYTLGDEVLANTKDVFQNETNGSQLTFILNGEPTNDIANKVINSEDKLLINYGQDNQATLEQRFEQIQDSAGEANRTHDPASCAGSHQETFWDKLKQAVGISASRTANHKHS